MLHQKLRLSRFGLHSNRTFSTLAFLFAIIHISVHNEYHEMGARLVANALEMDGWDVKYLGANTPGDDILKITERIQPALLAVSVTMPFNLENVFELTNEVKKTRSTMNTRIMLGGLALNNSPKLAESFAADGYAHNCRDSVTLARRWWEEAPLKNEAS